MAINSAADLLVRKEYFMVTVEGDARYATKVTLKQIWYPSKMHPDLARVEVFSKKDLSMVFDLWEIGFGETRSEAAKNFGCFK